MKDLSFEQAFVRLEEILERMNAQNVTLEESLTLFEEANKLLVHSQKRLHDAEKRIEVLIRNRQGELSLDAKGSPETAPLHDERASK
jgi:exodeoxyribonuclease VII small subunit